jgi:hypothetical protein
MVEARRTGELELLLTSPVGARTMVSSQWKQLKRLFLVPVIFLAGPNLVLWIYGYFTIQYKYNPVHYGGTLADIRGALTLLLQCVNTILGIGALIWAGLWFGLRTRSQTGAIIQIVLWARAVPYVMIFTVSSLLRPFLFPGSTYYNPVRVQIRYMVYLLYPVADCIYYFCLIRWARRRLATEMANPSQEESGLAESMSAAWAGLASWVRKARNWPPAPQG